MRPLSSWFGLLFAGFCLLSLTAAALLRDPRPIPLPPAMSKAQVQQIILAALDYRGWQPGKVENNALVATLAIRKHMIKMIIDFSGADIVFRYKESINMKYLERSGLQYIHENYNVWTGLLAEDIAAKLNPPATGGKPSQGDATNAAGQSP